MPPPPPPSLYCVAVGTLCSLVTLYHLNLRPLATRRDNHRTNVSELHVQCRYLSHVVYTIVYEPYCANIQYMYMYVLLF